MDETYVIYTSEAGHTKRYAEMLSDKLNLPLLELCEAVKKLKKNTTVIYAGWLFANSVKGLKKARKYFNIKCVCAVGLCPTGQLLKEVRAANNIPDSIALFTVQGGMDTSRLEGINKFMINTLIKMLKKNKSPSEADREKLKLIECGKDFVSEDNLKDILEFCKEI